jgi:glutamyl-tRNA synthetase
MFNYLALQGWSYDDHTEVMTGDELVERFSIERVQASPARWNPEKLLDMNGIYIRKLSPEELTERLLPFLERAELIDSPPTPEQRAYVAQLVPLIHERLKTLDEAPDLLAFFFRDVQHDDPALLVPKKLDAEQTLTVLHAVGERLAALDAWDAQTLEDALRPLTQELGFKTGQVFGAVRVAITGRGVAPPLFDTLTALGRERSLSRIEAAANVLA